MRKFWRPSSRSGNRAQAGEPCEPVETDSFTDGIKAETGGDGTEKPALSSSALAAPFQRLRNLPPAPEALSSLPRTVKLALIVLVLIILILFIAVIALAARNQKPSFYSDPTICVEPACLRASAFVSIPSLIVQLSLNRRFFH